MKPGRSHLGAWGPPQAPRFSQKKKFIKKIKILPQIYYFFSNFDPKNFISIWPQLGGWLHPWNEGYLQFNHVTYTSWATAVHRILVRWPRRQFWCSPAWVLTWIHIEIPVFLPHFFGYFTKGFHCINTPNSSIIYFSISFASKKKKKKCSIQK